MVFRAHLIAEEVRVGLFGPIRSVGYAIKLEALIPVQGVSTLPIGVEVVAGTIGGSIDEGAGGLCRDAVCERQRPAAPKRTGGVRILGVVGAPDLEGAFRIWGGGVYPFQHEVAGVHVHGFEAVFAMLAPAHEP